MAFVGSYLWRLRQKVGSDLVLMPGAMVVLRDGEGRVLLTRRVDDGTWCLPAGGAEEGAGFAETAAAELREETGAVVPPQELRADEEEVRELGFFALDAPPEPLHPPTAAALALYREYLRTGSFQAS